MASDSDSFEYSDEEIDERKHQKIIEDVLNLNKVQNLKKPTRTEPTLHISEFDLVKSVTGNKGAINLSELTKVLKDRKKHEVIDKKVAKASKKNSTLPKPLEKPLAEKIRRSVAYEKNRLEFDRWEGYVMSNRAAPHLSFPLLETDSLKIEKDSIVPDKWRVKSELQKKNEALEKVEEFHIKTKEEEFPLTMEELMETRKEAAKLRAHQSYKEAKARRQNKIKSKKFHRIQRRERIKEQLKEFEQLQKTNPEEALKKLEDIERARAEERFSLRHKGTGQWAKNKQIRAKYDKESRKVLAQQLSISRDLTQKLKKGNDSDEDEGIESEENTPVIDKNGDNPWVNGMKPASEVLDFVSGYRKFWNEQNMKKTDETNTEEQNMKKTDEANTEEHSSDDDDVKQDFNEDDMQDEVIENFKEQLKQSKKQQEVKKDIIPKTNKSDKTKSKKLKKSSDSKSKSELKVIKPPKINKSLNDSQSTSEWEVEQVNTTTNGLDLEDAFDQLENKLKSKMKQKLKNINKINGVEKKKTPKKSKEPKKKIDLSMKSKTKKPIIDEPLNEGDESNTNELNALKAILNEAENEDKSENIDPNKFMNVKKTELNTAIPDILTADEDPEENDSQREIIMEAFEDDDIVADFNKEKADEIDKDKPKDIDLNLPGWGNWGGTGIVPNKRKKKRFIIKMPEKIPRRDDNKGSLIINENAADKIREHMVSEVPFPFKTVKDFQASIRASIGNSFMPETAFRRLTEPAVKTKMGVIIEPVTRASLVGVKKS